MKVPKILPGARRAEANNRAIRRYIMLNPFTLPTVPAALQAIIDADRERFAGWLMMADQAGAGDAGAAGGAGAAAGDAGTNSGGAATATDTGGAGKDGDETLGEAGKKTLDKERTQRKELEKEIAGLKAFQTKFTQFVTGLTGNEQATTTEEGLKQLTDQVSALTHQNLVERIARENKIEDEDDVALLRAMRTEDEVRALATRLAKAAAAATVDDGKGGRKPKPDPSAGKGGTGGTGGEGKPASVAEVMAARRAAREAKSKTN
jgi:hypothetical protein